MQQHLHKKFPYGDSAALLLLEVDGNDEAEIADLRAVDAGIVDLVDDAVAEREPDARAAEAAADDVLGAARPGRGDAALAGRRAVPVEIEVNHDGGRKRPTAGSRP